MTEKQFASHADVEEKQISWDKLSDNAYAYTAEGDPNTGVIIGDDGCMIIDATASAAPMPDDLEAWLDRQERQMLVRALNETGFNRTAAAARLGLNLRQMRYRMARLGITAPNGDEHGDGGG